MNVAFLLGLADEFDSRAAVSTDLDLDGRVDVIVVEDRAIRGKNSTSTAIESRRRTIG